MDEEEKFWASVEKVEQQLSTHEITKTEAREKLTKLCLGSVEAAAEILENMDY